MLFCPSPETATTSLSRVLNEGNFTGGVSRVDDTQGSGVAVAPGLIQGALQLADVHTPALFFIKVIVDLHGAQFGQRSRVQRILRYGDHDAGTGRTLAAHQQLQHGLKEQDGEVKKGVSPTVLSTYTHFRK